VPDFVENIRNFGMSIIERLDAGSEVKESEISGI
jgi:hypothetical protein